MAVTVTGVLTMSDPALAKAAYAGKADMIHNSEIIAVVDFTAPEKTEQKGTSWTYSQKAKATVETVLKGKPARELTVYGGENFICAQCALQKGKALVFLNHNRDLLVGSNWHLSIRPIEKNEVEWYDGENMRPLKKMPLPAVLEEIRKILPQKQNLAPPFAVLFDASSLDDTQIGEGGGPSKFRRAYQQALPLAAKHKDELKYITEAGSPAGRIYAAMLLHHADKESGKKALISLSCCNGTVVYRSGCEIMHEGIWNIASKLYSDGKFLSLQLD